MLVKTKHFGEINVEDNKLLLFEDGLLGLTEYKKFVIVFDSEDNNPIISWLQSTEDKNIALPIVNPLFVEPNYAPIIEDELIKKLGEVDEELLLIFSVMVIPEDVKEMTANLMAPIIIHTETKKGCQIIAENKEYSIKYPIYDNIKDIYNCSIKDGE